MISLSKFSSHLLILILLPASWVKADPSNLIAVTEHHPPVQYIEDDEIKGFATEIVKALLDQTNLKADLQIVPWARAYDKALNRPNTLIFSMLRTEDRESLFRWIGPVSQINVAVIGLHNKDHSDLATLEDARSSLFAVVRNAYSHDYLLKRGFSTEENIFLAGTMQEQVDLLLKGKVDYLLTDPIAINQRLINLGYTGTEILPLVWIPELSRDLYLAASLSTDDEIVAALTAALKRMQQTEFYQMRYNLKAQCGDMNVACE